MRKVKFRLVILIFLMLILSLNKNKGIVISNKIIIIIWCRGMIFCS